MIYRYLILGMATLSLLFASCKQEDLQPSAQEAAEEYQYVEVDLSTGVDEDDLRILFSGDASSSIPKVNFSYGKNGDKVRVRTCIYRQETRFNPSTRSNENFNVIGHDEVLEWTVDRDGKGLVYKGKVRLPKAWISSREGGSLHVYCLIGDDDPNYVYRTTARLLPLKSYTKLNPLDMKIPSLGGATLRWADEKRGRLVSLYLRNPEGSTDFVRNNYLHTYGDIIMITVKNNLGIPISPTRLQHYISYPRVLGYPVLVGASVEPLASGFSDGLTHGTYVYDLTAVGTRLRPNEVKYYYNYFPDGTTIAPGATEHYFVWYPNYALHGGSRDTHSYLWCQFIEPEATSQVRLSSYPDASEIDVQGAMYVTQILRWTFEVGQP